MPISVGKKTEFNDFIFLFRFSGLSTFSYRNKFDLALPSYTILQEENVKANSRNINLVVLQGSEVHDKLKPLIGNLKNKPGKIIQIIFWQGRKIIQILSKRSLTFFSKFRRFIRVLEMYTTSMQT